MKITPHMMKLLLITTLFAGSYLFSAGPAPATPAEVNAKEDANPAIVDASTAISLMQKLAFVQGRIHQPAAELCAQLPQISPELYSPILQLIITHRDSTYLRTVIDGSRGRITPDHFTTAVVSTACDNDQADALTTLAIVLNQIDPKKKSATINAMSSEYNSEEETLSGNMPTHSPLVDLSRHDPSVKPHVKVAFELLVKHGADINFRTCDRYPKKSSNMLTPLHHTIAKPHWIALLLEYGADPSIPDSNGKTPPEIAREYLTDALTFRATHPNDREYIEDRRWTEMVRIFDEASQYQATAYQVLVEILKAQCMGERAAQNLAAIFRSYVTPSLRPPTRYVHMWIK